MRSESLLTNGKKESEVAFFRCVTPCRTSLTREKKLVANELQVQGHNGILLLRQR